MGRPKLKIDEERGRVCEVNFLEWVWGTGAFAPALVREAEQAHFDRLRDLGRMIARERNERILEIVKGW